MTNVLLDPAYWVLPILFSVVYFGLIYKFLLGKGRGMVFGVIGGVFWGIYWLFFALHIGSGAASAPAGVLAVALIAGTLGLVASWNLKTNIYDRIGAAINWIGKLYFTLAAAGATIVLVIGGEVQKVPEIYFSIGDVFRTAIQPQLLILPAIIGAIGLALVFYVKIRKEIARSISALGGVIGLVFWLSFGAATALGATSIPLWLAALPIIGSMFGRVMNVLDKFDRIILIGGVIGLVLQSFIFFYFAGVHL